MSTLRAVESFIRFQLDEMRSQNRHHDFEHLCALVAQRRVSSNILIATGPVSAGGDQGRDAESFFTRLPDELPGAAGFAGMASSDPVVVACTLQVGGVDSKVRSDLADICSQGQPVAHVAYFCVVGVPVAKVHKLQELARETFEVSLDVFDGPKLASLLAQRDLIWIAEEYLQLPSAMVPDDTSGSAPERYVRSLAALRQLGRPPSTAGDLATIRGGLRHATFNPAARGDLPEWLRYAERLLGAATQDDNQLEQDVAARARYEIVVATLRGLNTLDGVTDHADALLRYATTSDNPAILQDASTLLMYLGGAWLRHLGTMTAHDLTVHTSHLRKQVDSLIERTDATAYPTGRARLIAIAAHLAIQPLWDTVDRPEPGELSTPEALTYDALKAQGGLPQVDPDTDLIDVATAMHYLAMLAEHLPAAVGLPVETLCDMFDLFTPALARDPRYGKVRDALDRAVAAVQGDNAVADRCRNRALAFWRAEQPLAALREFHEAKAKWWHGDTLRGSLLTMRFIARIYSELRLPHAAKQYALAAASVASASNDPALHDIIPAAFLEAVDDLYVAGAWLDATSMVGLARLGHSELAEHPFDPVLHSDLERVEFHQVTVVLAAQTYRPDLTDWIVATLARTGYDDDILDLADSARTEFTRWTEAEFVSHTDDQLVGRPFSDTGPTRHLSFAALGTRWVITCDNDQSSVLAAERFAAGAQILLAELAQTDPLFLHADVNLDVRVIPPPEGERIDVARSNESIDCTVYLTAWSPDEPMDKLAKELLFVAVSVLATVSARPAEEFMAFLTSMYADGLPHKLLSGRPYDETADLFGDDHYAQLASLPASQLGTERQVPSPHPALAAPSAAPGPGYDRETAVTEITRRYDSVPSLVTQTLPSVLADEETREHLVDLRAQGWLDWHLLLAIYNVALNARAQYEGILIPPDGPTEVDPLMDLSRRPETAASPPIPLGYFSREALEFQLDLNTVQYATQQGLHIHTNPPDLRGLRELLRARYGYYEDTPHDDLLA